MPTFEDKVRKELKKKPRCLNGKDFYPTTVKELASLLAKLPPDMPVSSYDDYCLDVIIYDYQRNGVHVCDAVFDHGCRSERGHGPWNPDKDE